MSINITPKKSRHFSFDVQTATDYGVDEAIMIQNFIFWIEKNLANGKNHHDGRTWTYNTQQAFTFLFPFWSYKQIRRILDSLVKKDVLVTGNYNKTPFDRTLWYAFKDESGWLNIPDNHPKTLEDIDLSKRTNGDGDIEESHSPKRENGKMNMEESHSPKRENGKTQTGEPIPYITTNAFKDLKPNNNHAPEPSANPIKSVNEILLLSLVGLTEIQTREASKKLAKLSSNQRDLAIQIFNKTVSAGGVKSSPMALLNQLVNLGLENGLEPIRTIQPIPTTPQTPKTPVITDKERENTRIECIKAFVASKKADLLKEFSERGCVISRAFGTIIEPDLKLAGLFD
jgi:hypothetical protein